MCFVADEVIFSGYLPTRFTVSRSPIRNAFSLYDYFSVLHNFVNYHVIPKNRYLTSIAFPNRSPGEDGMQCSHSEEYRGAGHYPFNTIPGPIRRGVGPRA